MCSLLQSKYSVVLPLRQGQGISDGTGHHGEEVWSSREKTGRKLNIERWKEETMPMEGIKKEHVPQNKKTTDKEK